MLEVSRRQSHSVVEYGNNNETNVNDKVQSRSFAAPKETTSFVASAFSRNRNSVTSSENVGKKPAIQTRGHSDMDQMKEKFAKLLLGEDMSGGGKGVSSALALSNAITNLAASIFGESQKLEPMPAERKARWRKEVDWLLSVTDHIVEFVPSNQTLKDGTNMEIMVTRQRNDLHMNIPALRKLDAMLTDCLDQFVNQSDFWYVSANDDTSENEKSNRKDDKWWLPTPKVPPEGLSYATRKFLLFQKESVNQVLKAAMAINAQVLAEMEVPDSYIDSLPKNGRSSLGDLTYKNLTDEYFDPEQFLSTMDMTTEHKVVDLKSRIEASVVIWKRKMHSKDAKSAWGSTVSLEKRELFEERAETILLLIKQRFPGIPQSSLEISKIQCNRDVGQASLESYSRVLESLASAVMSKIEDILYVDSLTQNSEAREHSGKPPPSPNSRQVRSPNKEESPKGTTPTETPNSKSLSDFMDWTDKGNEFKKHSSTGSLDKFFKVENEKFITKIANIAINKKISYLEKLENLSGLKSPTARH